MENAVNSLCDRVCTWKKAFYFWKNPPKKLERAKTGHFCLENRAKKSQKKRDEQAKKGTKWGKKSANVVGRAFATS